VAALRRRWGVADLTRLLPALLVTVAAAGIRLWRVGLPRSYVFDEVYYVPDALTYLHGGGERAWVHPPLGKWLIAAGIRAFGDRPVGWRISSVVFGTAAVLLTYVLAHRLLHSRGWAMLASALVAVDGLQIVQSRIAMPDIFLTTFVLAGTVLGHHYVTAGPDPGGSEARPLGWLAGAGVMFGAALAVKWSALPVIGLAAIGVVATAAHRRRAAAVVAGFLGVVPLAVYLLSYARFWSRNGLDLGGWVRLQRAMLRFHTGDIGPHPYASPSLGWLLLWRPVAYFYEVRDGRVRHILALGNPLLWWGFLATVPSLLRAWRKRRDRAADLVVLAVAGLYLPWLLVRRTAFLYYLTPLVPFMAVGMAWALQRLWGSSLPRPIRRGVVITYVAATLAAAFFLLPVWLGLPIDARHWRRLMLFGSWI
jgi:dolichyl-phosphate-mannose--protein O-mannosyl transferase